MSESAIPFGLLFLERQLMCADQTPHAYDEERDVSVIEVNGEWFPVIWAMDPRMGTETFTEAAGEATDEPSLAMTTTWSLGTDTETKAAEDLTMGALEPRLVTLLATETQTSVAGEETD